MGKAEKKMQQQQPLWHESLEDALRSVVDFLGGPKVIGTQVWPTKAPQDAARYLNHCLDPERQEKLAPGEIVWILREGSKAGCHVGMHYLNETCFYDRAKPVSKEDRKAELHRQFNETAEHMLEMLKQIKRLD